MTTVASRWPGRLRRRSDRGWPVLIASVVIAGALLAPLVLIVLDVRRTGWSELHRVLFRDRSAMLLSNTVVLCAIVAVLSAAIGTGAAWLTERTTLPARRLWTVLLVLPVAIPDFVVGYAWHSFASRAVTDTRRDDRDDTRHLSARLPAGGGRAAALGPRARGDRSRAGGGSPGRVQAGDAAAGGDGGPGRCDSRGADGDLRVRRVRDPRATRRSPPRSSRSFSSTRRRQVPSRSRWSHWVCWRCWPSSWCRAAPWSRPRRGRGARPFGWDRMRCRSCLRSGGLSCSGSGCRSGRSSTGCSQASTPRFPRPRPSVSALGSTVMYSAWGARSPSCWRCRWRC